MFKRTQVLLASFLFAGGGFLLTRRILDPGSVIEESGRSTASVISPDGQPNDMGLVPSTPESRRQLVILPPVTDKETAGNEAEETEVLDVLSLTTEEEEEQFKWLRESTPESELERELDALGEVFMESYVGEAMRRLAEGEYEVVPEGPDGRRVVTMDPRRRHLVEFYSSNTEGEPVRLVLPESKYPEAYKIKRQMNWLEDLIAASEWR